MNNCIFCRVKRKSKWALLFSAPIEVLDAETGKTKDVVDKFHVCPECFKTIFKLMAKEV